MTDIDIAEARVLRLQPGDKVCLVSKGPLSAEQVRRIKDEWSRVYPDFPVVVMCGLEPVVYRSVD